MKKFYVERIGLHVTCWTYHSAERIPVSEETVAQGKIEGAEIFYIPPEDATLEEAIIRAGHRLLERKKRDFIRSKTMKLSLGILVHATSWRTCRATAPHARSNPKTSACHRTLPIKSKPNVRKVSRYDSQVTCIEEDAKAYHRLHGDD